MVLDPETVVFNDGRALLGGDPLRLMRLTSAGGTVLTELLAHPVRDAREGALARRLLDAGVAHPRSPRGPVTGPVTVVIPVRDRPAELGRLLAALCAESCDDAPAETIVVDDGSTAPDTVAAVVARYGARLVRRSACGGPAAARNTGLAAASDAELVAFLDSDCVPPPGWLSALAAHFADPEVGAVAPRIRPRATGRSTLAAYAAARSPLDLDHRAARVRPGSRVAYVPTATLLVRRAALDPVAFDESLRFGEDVDAVWRMIDAGWTVRYDPSVRVAHDEPATWATYLRRRFRYGTSGGPLGRRHGDRLAPVVLRPWSSAVAGLLLAGRPGLAATVTAASAAWFTRALRETGMPTSVAARLTLRPVGGTLVGMGRALTQLGLPVAVATTVALPGRRARRLLVLGGLVAAPALRDWAVTRTRLDPVRWTLASVVDDMSYGAGVWWGALRSRSLAPLLPRFVRDAGAGRRADAAAGR
ncbi:mycofactocin biosynthesis glycosyltransferase MftF [Spiractinospora alimapuensis]|nr:mycofactocin biosynthesis glycosyltransferase MftF [Spiractinospora alimapuensis]